MNVQQIGNTLYKPAPTLAIGDEILTAGTIKRILTTPRHCNGYMHFDVDDVIGLGRGTWNVRADLEIPTLVRAPL